MRIGELFILGFFGKTVPVWLKEFAARYGLGGVILFDYSCRTQQYDNNIESPEQVQRLCREIVARAQRIGLCLKHFPGIGGAVVDSHQEFMDISDALRDEQEELFYSLAPDMFGDAVLVSHAIVSQWDKDRPMTLSAAGLGRMRKRLPDTLLITDDMQMQGLQKALGTREASLQSLKAGIDMLCIGNNLFDQEQEMAAIAEYVERSLCDKTLSGSAIEKSIARVARRKALLMA